MLTSKFQSPCASESYYLRISTFFQKDIVLVICRVNKKLMRCYRKNINQRPFNFDLIIRQYDFLRERRFTTSGRVYLFYVLIQFFMLFNFFLYSLSVLYCSHKISNNALCTFIGSKSMKTF